MCRAAVRIALCGVFLAGTSAGASAHQVGLAEQVLQPVTSAHTALPVMATALLLRQHDEVSISHKVVLALAAGLLAGLMFWTLIGQSARWPVAPLVMAIALGALVAWGRTWSLTSLLVIVAALGAGLGANLLTETHDAFDFTTSLAGALGGTLAVLQIATTLPRSFARNWQAVAERIAGSWVVAIATMITALAVRQMM